MRYNSKTVVKILAVVLLLGNTGFGIAQSLVSYETNLRSNADFQSKEIALEVNAGRGTDIRINNNNRSIEIKTWNEPKVKVVTTIYYEGDASKLSDE